MGFIAGLIGGALAGAAGHRLLHTLRRGTSVHMGWCVGGVGALWSVVGWQWATGSLPWWWLPIPTAMAWFGVLLVATDLRHSRLPDALTLPAYPVLAAATALAASQAGWQVATGATLGALVLYCLYAAVNLVRPTALGGGDVKLSGTAGAALGAIGWPAVLVGTTLAAILTLTLQALAPRRTRARWRTGIPHGPGLLAATYLLTTFPGPTIPP
jgi:leader peptidase (prepilin peptidase)/N-methyltransferase